MVEDETIAAARAANPEWKDQLTDWFCDALGRTGVFDVIDIRRKPVQGAGSLRLRGEHVEKHLEGV